MSLEDLVSKGPDPSRGLQEMVLAQFQLITAARANLRQWREIALEMGLDARRVPALCTAYKRLARRIEKGELIPPGMPVAGRNAKPPRPGGAGVATGGCIPAPSQEGSKWPPPPVPGQRQETTTLMDDGMDKFRKQFGK